MLKKLWSSLKGEELSQVERWAIANSHRTTPDDLIAGAIVESMAKHWDDWEGVGLSKVNYCCVRNWGELFQDGDRPEGNRSNKSVPR